VIRTEPYYRRDLALVHHLGFGFHAEMVAPGIVELLEDVRHSNGLVLEVGCGSGLLTKRLVAAGLRVLATDASPAMLELARETVPGAEAIEQLTLPDDPIPRADAIVGVGHPLSYLPDAASLERALARLADSLAPGGVFATDLCDFEWGELRRDRPPLVEINDTWALINYTSVPARDSFVREMTIFVRRDDGAWDRDDERHDNVLIDVSGVPALLAEHGVDAEVRDSFGAEKLPAGLKAVVGRKSAS
jgi:SAM-dependent methyltransferase